MPGYKSFISPVNYDEATTLCQELLYVLNIMAVNTSAPVPALVDLQSTKERQSSSEDRPGVVGIFTKWI